MICSARRGGLDKAEPKEDEEEEAETRDPLMSAEDQKISKEILAAEKLLQQVQMSGFTFNLFSFISIVTNLWGMFSLVMSNPDPSVYTITRGMDVNFCPWNRLPPLQYQEETNFNFGQGADVEDFWLTQLLAKITPTFQILWSVAIHVFCPKSK